MSLPSQTSSPRLGQIDTTAGFTTRRWIIAGLSSGMIGLLGWRWWSSPPTLRPEHIPSHEPLDIIEGTQGPQLIVYTATTCPHCAEFHRTILPELRTRWVQTGKLHIIHRGFPLSLVDVHIEAILHLLPTPLRLACLDQIFATQDTWLPQIIAHARIDPTAPIDVTPYMSAVLQHIYPGSLPAPSASMVAEVIAVRAHALDAGVRATPAFLTPQHALIEGVPTTAEALVGYR